MWTTIGLALAAAVSMRGGTGTFTLAADLYGDGHTENLLSYCNDADGIAYVKITDAKAPEQTYKVSCPAGIAVGDFNGDRVRDVVGVSWDGQGPLGMFQLVGNGQKAFNVVDIDNKNDWAGGIVAADFNGDGKTDVAVPVQSEDDWSITAIKILSGPDFKEVGSIPAPAGIGDKTPATFEAKDVDGDGKVDIVMTVDSKPTVYYGDGAFGFSTRLSGN